MSELLKIYSGNLALLSNEECARLHQYGADQEKLGSEIKKVTYHILMNTFKGKFPQLINKRVATVREAGTRAPSSITWETLQEIGVPITEEMFLECSALTIGNLKKNYPDVHKALTQTKWFKNNTTKTSGYISWSKPTKK